MSAHGINPYGFNPVISVDFYKKVIVPIALYGCQL